MTSNFKKAKNVLCCIAFVYTVVMLWLLFGRRRFDIGLDYWEQVKMNINLVPFNTIWQYLYLMIKRTNTYLVPHAFVNLFGNIVAFVPLGFLLPYLWKRVQSFGRFLLCTISVISSVEIVQLFTLRGSCDIDDLILNLLGAIMGYIVFRFFKHRFIRIKPDAMTQSCE